MYWVFQDLDRLEKGSLVSLELRGGVEVYLKLLKGQVDTAARRASSVELGPAGARDSARMVAWRATR